MFNATEEVSIEQIVNRYGIGVDCHSRFFQICVLARCGDAIYRLTDRCEADYDDLPAARAKAVEWLRA